MFQNETDNNKNTIERVLDWHIIVPYFVIDEYC